MTAPPPADASPGFTARAAGVFWLMTIVTGSVALTLGGKVLVPGDAAATAARLLALGSSYRLALAANLLATVCYIGATLLVYELLKPVNRQLSLLAAFFSLVGCASGAVGFLFHLAPLAVLSDAPYLKAFTVEQLQALAMVFLRLRGQAEIINFVFFGLHCLLIGCLIVRSTFLPRAVGVLMVLAGLGWLTQSFGALLAPSLARSLAPFIMAAGGLGECSLTLWLLIAGVNAQRWKEQAGTALEWRSYLTPSPVSIAR